MEIPEAFRDQIDKYKTVTYAKEGNEKALRELLDMGVDPNTLDLDEHTTALHVACTTGQNDIIDMLLTRGADVNALNSSSQTPLHLVLQAGNVHLAQKLVRAGALLYLKDSRNLTPLDYAQPHVQRMMLECTGEMTKEEKQISTFLTSWQIKPKVFNCDESALQKTTAVERPPERITVFIGNGDSNKVILVTPKMNAGDVVKLMCSKCNIAAENERYFDIAEKTSANPGGRRLGSGENLFTVRSKWPKVLSSSDDPDSLKKVSAVNRFKFVCKNFAPTEVQETFNRLWM